MSLKVLAFDTSANNCSVAILNAGQETLIHQVAPKQQAQLILPMIQSSLQQANLTIKDLDAIAYSCGPGSFTGLRIASSVAQGLAFAENTPVIQVSSLAALAQSAFEENNDFKNCHFLTAIDARVQEIYWAEYVVQENGLVALSGIEQIANPLEIEFARADDEYIALGDGWLPYRDILSSKAAPKLILAEQSVTAKAVLHLALDKFAREGGIGAAQAIPIYLR